MPRHEPLGERITALTGKFSCYCLPGQVDITSGMSAFTTPLHPGTINLPCNPPRRDDTRPSGRGWFARSLYTTRSIRIHYVPQMTNMTISTWIRANP